MFFFSVFSNNAGVNDSNEITATGSLFAPPGLLLDAAASAPLIAPPLATPPVATPALMVTVPGGFVALAEAAPTLHDAPLFKEKQWGGYRTVVS